MQYANGIFINIQIPHPEEYPLTFCCPHPPPPPPTPPPAPPPPLAVTITTVIE